MCSPELYQSQSIDYLGLVAALYDELGIGKLIDRLIHQDLKQIFHRHSPSTQLIILNVNYH